MSNQSSDPRPELHNVIYEVESTEEAILKLRDYLLTYLDWKGAAAKGPSIEEQFRELFDEEIIRARHHDVPTVNEVMQDCVTGVDRDRYSWVINDLHVKLTADQLRPCLEAAYDPDDRNWQEKVVIERPVAPSPMSATLLGSTSVVNVSEPAPVSSEPLSSKSLSADDQWQLVVDSVIGRLATALLDAGLAAACIGCSSDERELFMTLKAAKNEQLEHELTVLARRATTLAQAAVMRANP